MQITITLSQQGVQIASVHISFHCSYLLCEAGIGHAEMKIGPIRHHDLPIVVEVQQDILRLSVWGVVQLVHYTWADPNTEVSLPVPKKNARGVFSSEREYVSRVRRLSRYASSLSNSLR